MRGFLTPCRRASHEEAPWAEGIPCRCPPAEQRAPFVCGCTPEVSGPSHETGRVRLLTQRTALTTARADAAHRWFSFLSSRRPAWPSAPWSLPCPVTRACPKADRPRFGFPCDGSHASRPSSRQCVADSRQRHALAVPVFKTATRFAALTDPVRFASPTADARRPGDDALFSTTRGEPHPLRDACSPTHQGARHV